MKKEHDYHYILRTKKLCHAAAKLLILAFNSELLHEVIIRPFKSTRSQQQNRYYWKVLALMGEHFGYTKDELHEYFKSEFLEPKESIVFGEEVKEYATTTKLKKDEFAWYMDQITMRVAEQGYAVPVPLALGYEL